MIERRRLGIGGMAHREEPRAIGKRGREPNVRLAALLPRFEDAPVQPLSACIETHLALVATPDITLPSAPFRWGQDAVAQVERGVPYAKSDAFLRAWDTALFGPGAADGDDGTAMDEADRPFDVLTDDRTTLAGPRLPDVLLYWLDRPSIDALAPLTAEPPPSEVHRAFLVRVAP